MSERCFWCRRWHKRLTNDHVMPRSIGGVDTVRACYDCNQERGKIVSAYCALEKIRQNIALFSEKFEGRLRRHMIRRTLRSMSKNMEYLLNLQRFWVMVETDRLGYSPSGELKLVLPDTDTCYESRPVTLTEAEA